jgi:hypothetical protein
MTKVISQSRAQRRNYEKFLKATNPVAYKEWKENSLERGNQYKEEHTQIIEDKQTKHFEDIQAKLIQDLLEQGKSQGEIDRHIAIWIKTIKPWGSTEKPLSWKSAEKEYDLEISKIKNK